MFTSLVSVAEVDGVAGYSTLQNRRQLAARRSLLRCQRLIFRTRKHVTIHGLTPS